MFLLRRAVASAARTPRTITTLAVKPIFPRHAPFVFRTQRVAYSSAPALTKEGIQDRIFDVLKSFEKVAPEKIKTSASFTNDLGLDSLDTVEVLMAVEEEFGIEIPDEEADEITTVQEAIEYIAKTPAAH